MPARDYFHDHFKNALVAEGWHITHDPYFLRVGRRKGFIDLGAEMLAAERKGEKIAVEIKSFRGMSDLDAFEDALGKFLVYKKALKRKEAERTLYLAVPYKFYQSFFDDPFFVEIAQDYEVFLIVYDESETLIHIWKKL